jgi:hypothetical protein
MPTTRRLPDPPADVETQDADFTDAPGSSLDDTVQGPGPEGADPRTDALAALLAAPRVSPSEAADAEPDRFARRLRPEPTGIVHEWEPGGARWMVWSDLYPRVLHAERATARRGDVVVVPDDAVTAEHVGYGYLIPETG